MAEFEEYYKQLNKAQREAVDTVEGPVMVVAGPGTGKTQILTLRIANILRETQVGPENILALTFTEAGAVAMRRRLAEIIGSLAYHVRIGTFHGFCNDIIKKYPEEFPRVIGADHITEVEQVQVIQEIITRLSLKLLKPFGDPFYFVRDINSAIQDLKREGVEPSAFKKIVDKEAKELKILEAYLPEQMGEEEVRKLVKEAIASTGAKTAQEMGKVMSALMPKVKGKADGSLVSKIVKELLT